MPVALVVERDGLERQDRIAGLVHRLDFLLKTPRGRARGELAVGIDQDWYAVPHCPLSPREYC